MYFSHTAPVLLTLLKLNALFVHPIRPQNEGWNSKCHIVHVLKRKSRKPLQPNRRMTIGVHKTER